MKIIRETSFAGLCPAARGKVRDIYDLGDRLRHDVRLIVSHKGKSALEIFGSPDDLKFRSCITLFYEAASDQSDRSLFAEALQQFYKGEADPRTLELLRHE